MPGELLRVGGVGRALSAIVHGLPRVLLVRLVGPRLETFVLVVPQELGGLRAAAVLKLRFRVSLGRAATVLFLVRRVLLPPARTGTAAVQEVDPHGQFAGVARLPQAARQQLVRIACLPDFLVRLVRFEGR